MTTFDILHAEPEQVTELPLDNLSRIIYKWTAPRLFPKGSGFVIIGNYQLAIQGGTTGAVATMYVVDLVITLPNGSWWYVNKPNGENIPDHAQHYATGPEVGAWKAPLDIPAGSIIDLRARADSTSTNTPLLVKQNYGRLSLLVLTP